MKLCDIQIQWIPVGNRHRPDAARASTSEETSEVRLLFSHERCEVIETSGNVVATLNTKTYLALRTLTSINEIYFKGYIRPENKNGLTSSAVQSDKSTITPMRKAQNTKSSIDLLVFGPQLAAEVLAKEMARYRLFLQHPFPIPSDVPYENPQYFNISGVSLSNGSLLPAIQGLEDVRNESNASPSQEDNGQAATNLAHVLDHLPQHDYLKEASIDSRIKTPLLRLVIEDNVALQC